MSKFFERKTNSKIRQPKTAKSRSEGGLRLQGSFRSSHTNSPLVTIITVVYNGERHLEQTILSVLNQTYKNIEYILIDGGSNDGTLDIIKKYTHAIDYWISEQDSGIYDAMNKGISLANGDIIGIINSDDWYSPDAIRMLADVEDARNKIVCFSMDYYDEHSQLIKAGVKPSRSLQKLRYRNIIFHPSSFIGIDVYRKIGLYDANLKISADYKFFLSSYLSGVSFVFNELTASAFRDGGASSGFGLNNLKENISLRKDCGIWPYSLFEVALFIYLKSKKIANL